MVELDKITDADILIAEAKRLIASEEVELQYMEAVDLETLETVTCIKKNTGILAAIKVGKVRLIDNIIWE